MTLVRTAALSRHTAPTYVLIPGLDLLQLRKPSWVARWVFVEMCAMADFRTGHVETSYAVLIALLDFDRAPQANKVPRPTVQMIRTAIDELLALGLIKHVDRKLNKRHKALFFLIAPRHHPSSSDDMRNRQRNRPSNDAKLATARVSKGRTSDAQQTAQQRVQKRNSIPPTPSLSTAAARKKAQADLRALADQLRRDAGIK